jgi:hypothetical protein
MRLKNGKVEQEGGAITGFYDPKNSQVTFIDPQRKLFATTTLQDLVAQLLASMPARPPMSPQVKMIVESLTTTYASRKTGRTEMTLGLETEETEFTFSVNMTLPPARATERACDRAENCDSYVVSNAGGDRACSGAERTRGILVGPDRDER